MGAFIQNNKRYLIYIGIFSYMLFLSSLFPMHWWDEFYFAEPGNPWLLQWEQFFVDHGRIWTHVLVRYALQLGYPYVYIMKALVIFTLFFLSLKVIDPKSLEANKWHYGFLLSVFLLINALLPFTTFMMYYASDLLNISSYYLPAIMILLFMLYYLNIFQGKTEIKMPMFFFISFLAGASHEQAITLVPMMIIMYVLLKIKHIEIPKWYWLSLIPFFLGFAIIIFSPGSSSRITSYAKAESWEFMGQTINWLDLGWKKYFYSFFRHTFLTVSNWHSGPGYIPSTWYIQVLIFIFILLNLKKYKSLLDNNVLFPILFWMLSWGTVVVMSASPMFHGNSVEFSKFFLYISLTGAIYYYLKDSSKKVLIILSSLFCAIVLIGQGIQVKPISQAKKEYFELIEKIERGEITEISEYPEAKMGSVSIIRFGWHGLPYKYPHIKFN